MKTYKEYKDEIDKATTMEELIDISYEAYLQDANPYSENSIANKVFNVCINKSIILRREE